MMAAWVAGQEYSCSQYSRSAVWLARVGPSELGGERLVMGIGGRELATRERVSLMKAGETLIVKGCGEEGKVASVFGRREADAEAVVAQRRGIERSMVNIWIDCRG